MRKRVLVFGTFDRFHPGHEFFLRSAKSRGTELVVAVARDAHVRALKDKHPQRPEHKRLQSIEELPYVMSARLSDEELGSFEVVKFFQPDLIVLGHDQIELEQALIAWMGKGDDYIPMMRAKKL